MLFDREKLKQAAAKLAAKGVYIGTSSWKYPGWRGMLYDESRYVYRGKFAETRFERDCLAEYAEVFKTVCVDAGYYRFPDLRQIKGLMSQVPDDFLFTFKVTELITVKKFTKQRRYGARAGIRNENFLSVDFFTYDFAKRLARSQ